MSNRIDRIDGNKYYEYTKIKNLNVSDADEKFSLDYKQDGLQTEKKEKKEKPEDEQELKQPEAYNGVRLDISNKARQAGAQAAKSQSATAREDQTALSPLELLTSIRDFVTTALAAVKEFFYKLWNDPQPESGNTESIEQTAAQLTETAQFEQPEATFDTSLDALNAYHQHEELLDREIQPYLRSGDLNQVISLLTDNGRKAAARNSTLLTYYDRNGRMVEPNASDRERILYGDRNTRKL